MDSLAPYNERAEKLKHNKTYYFAFLDALSNERNKGEITGNTPQQYTNKVINFLEYFDGRGVGIEKVTKDNIYQYADNTHKNIGPVFRSALKRVFAVIESPAISVDEINALKSTKTSSREASPLSVSEIIEIRNKLKMNDEYKFLFLFEMFFTYGISFDEFKQISKDSFRLEEQLFETRLGKAKILSKAITELIASHNDLPKTKVRGTIQGHIRKIGELVERDKLIWQDIMKTRELYFPLCHRCHEKYPNTEEFWVLLEHEVDKSKTRWLLCKTCAKKQLDGQVNG